MLANTKFSVNDLSDLPPSKSIQVILSRNNFIYYNSTLQDKVTHLFYNSLALNGFLIIGIKESLNGCSDLKKFIIENENEKVYKKIEA